MQAVLASFRQGSLFSYLMEDFVMGRKNKTSAWPEKMIGRVARSGASQAVVLLLACALALTGRVQIA